MTDPEFADATYIEPITAEYVEKVIADQAAQGFPVDAMLATLGGQTALNTAIALDERGVLDQVRGGTDRRRHRRPSSAARTGRCSRTWCGPRRRRPRSAVCHTMDEVGPRSRISAYRW